MFHHARATVPGRAGPPNPSRAMPVRADCPFPRSGFTLVELLVVMVVIAILAGIALAALSSARETARIAKTKSTIVKLDRLIMAKYESYLTRRLPLGTSQLRAIALGYSSDPKTVARVKMNAIRDLIRMEMPDRWNDVANGDATGTIRGPLVSGLTTPSLTRRYWNAFHRAVTSSGKDRATVEKYGPAECLYQIVMSDPEAASLFQENETGDSDGDGLKEFHDAWGRPIMFIRWPAGFLSTHHADTDLQTGDGVDPFDPQQILTDHYPLFPLIYSAGPDGVYDVSCGKSEGASGQHADDDYYRYKLTDGNLNPYISLTPALVGQPYNFDATDNSDGWYDNIHNHRLGGK